MNNTQPTISLAGLILAAVPGQFTADPVTCARCKEAGK